MSNLLHALPLAAGITALLLVAVYSLVGIFSDANASVDTGLRFLDTDRELSAPEALRDIPDPTWDRPFSERDRLREIPLQRQPGSSS
jgi:hypothetical protein